MHSPIYPLPCPAAVEPSHRRIGVKAGLAAIAALAATVMALPMFAQAGPGLAPSAEPSGCRPAGEQVQCSISVSFNAVEGATYYTASLLTPGGATIPYGQIATGGAGRIGSSVSFAFAGNGPYTVSVQAWGVTETGTPTEQATEDASAAVDGGAGDEPK